jgi:hypothetical protein
MASSTLNYPNLRETFEHRVLRGLVCEWKTALWVLPLEFRNKMRVPFISIKDMKSRWGYWSRERREMCLSRNLIYQNSWEKIREVVHHEIAHQLADEVLGKTIQESPHGPVFQKACHLLRIDPKASRDLESAKNPIQNELSSPETKLNQRIKKLMALANSQNINEAESAMAKAHYLMAKYSIHLVANDIPRNFTSAFLGKPALRHSRDVYYLANLLQDFYFVEGIWISTYVLEKGKMGRVLEISGTQHHVQIASYVYDFVQNYSLGQWQKYNKGKRLNHYRKIDFLVGVVEGFREKLKSQYSGEKRKQDQYALIQLKDPLLNAYTLYKYPHITRLKKIATFNDVRVMNDGKYVGENMVLHKAIAEKSGYENKLIELKAQV